MIRAKVTAIALLIAIAMPLAMTGPVHADGKASTRNILLGGAAATLIILNHNKKVHQRYAEDARKQAAIASERDDARAAYVAERNAYDNEVAMVSELNKEVAAQHSIIMQQRKQIAALNVNRAPSTAVANANRGFGFAAPRPAAAQKAKRPAMPNLVVAYGWGKL